MATRRPRLPLPASRYPFPEFLGSGRQGELPEELPSNGPKKCGHYPQVWLPWTGKLPSPLAMTLPLRGAE